MIRDGEDGQVHHYERKQTDSFLLGKCLIAYGGDYILAHLIQNVGGSPGCGHIVVMLHSLISGR